MQEFMTLLIIVLAVMSLIRMGIFLVATDWYEIKQYRRYRDERRATTKPYRPWISVVIPAYNEELCIIRTVESVLANTYSYKQIIVVDDGSKDRTLSKLRYFKRKHDYKNLKIIHQKNAGKAAAINNAIRSHAKGSLVMVLDADSLLERHAIENMVRHFAKPQVIASAANVKVLDDDRLIGLAQRIEYLISYRLKRALTVMNMEYIIGGVGSTFRKKAVQAVKFYDTDTITEDIDFTLKLIVHNGNKGQAINYAADAIAYTEAVMTLPSLIKQRFRWKYGRMQSFVKHRLLFLSGERRYDKRLTWFNLPYAIIGEFALLLEPLMFTFVIIIAYLHGDSRSLLSVYAIITAYVALNIALESSETKLSKLRLVAGVPIAYGLMYILTIVELAALLKSLGNIPALFSSEEKEGRWEHVERAGGAVLVKPEFTKLSVK